MVNSLAPSPTRFRGLSLIALLTILSLSPASAATWTKLANPAPASIQIMVQMTDGTILAQSYDDAQSWMKLTPDASGSFVNGTWTMLAPGLVPRLYFASQVLPDGRFWVTGGEYTGPGLLPNWGNSGEIYDPIANTWTAITPFPNQSGCPRINYVSGNLTSGSNVIANIYPYTTGLTVGWTVTGAGIPNGTTILSTAPTSITISNNATQTITASEVDFNHNYTLTGCVGDEPSVLVPGGNILLGDLVNSKTWLYNVAANSWTQTTGSKVYSNDSSDEEGWAKLPSGNIVNYDLFHSIDPAGNGSNLANGAYAETYNPTTQMWSSISPSDGSALGTIPQLSSTALGYELGPILRLQDGRVLVIGATQHTGIYNPATNTWAAGPDTMGMLTNSVNPSGTPAPFGADDAPAAIVPSGHVIFAADAGPSPVVTSGNITNGSSVITNIPSTALLQMYWAVSGTGIPSGAYIASIDSLTQIHLNANATSTHTADALTFGGIFSNPTQLFDFNPITNTVSPLLPAIPDSNLNFQGAYPSRMLTLPTGQVMFADASSQAWIYTPDGSASPALKPAVNNVTYNGGGTFTLTGKQLNGQSAGAAYGDDDQMDTNYPIVRFTATDGSGHVFYARTTNWSSLAVAGGLTTPQTVNFTLNPGMTTPGNYALTVSGAGITSMPVFVNITQAEINKQ